MIDRGRLDEVRAGRRDRIMTAPAQVELVRGGDNPWYQLTLTEGRNRQLRKMFEEIGHHVEKIRRIGYGALRLDVAAGRVPRADPGRGHRARPRRPGQEGRPQEEDPGVRPAQGPGQGRSPPAPAGPLPPKPSPAEQTHPPSQLAPPPPFATTSDARKVTAKL